MKIKSFKKKLSIKDIRLKSFKIMKKLNTIEGDELINFENIDELKSKTLLLKLLKSIKNSGNDFIEKDEDLLKTANLLFKIPSLQNFYKEYSINIKILKEMLNFIEIKYLYKGNCLFNQDEIPNKMFILLDGELSLKYNKNIKQESTLQSYVINEFNLDFIHYKNFNNLCDKMDKVIIRKNFRRPKSKNIYFNNENDNFNNSKLENEEIEFLKINDERFISQNNLLSLMPHSINCYVSSNECLVLILDKKSFNVSIQKSFMRYEQEYKKFICSRMNVFEKFHNETLNIYFYSWIKIYPKTHEKIFSINEEAKYFYLLYKGECINIISNRNINIFSKGSFIGLDSLFNPNKKYTSTVICKNDNTMLFRFDPLTFNEKILNDLKLELNQFYEIKIQTSNDFILKKENMENKFKHNYIHLTKNYIQDKLKKNEDRIDLIENNPFNMNILSEEKERDKEKTSLNNKRHNKLFISLNKLKNSLVIKKNKTQQNTEINLIKYTNFSINKNIPKIKLKKKNVLNIESLNSSSSLIKNRTFSKRKYNKNKIIKKYQKTNYSRLYLGKQLISSRNINRKNSPLSILRLSEDLELTLYSSYADPINKKTSFFEEQSICNDVDLLTLTDKGNHPNLFFNNNINRNKKTLIQKVELSCDKWKKTLNDSKKVFTTKHYKLPLISSINE